jgi:ech hydrogenase subunit D
MIEEQPKTRIELKDLLERAEKFFKEGYRLVLVTCTKIEDDYEITYSFDKDYSFQSLRMTIAAGTEIPSISSIYWGAFIFENEIHDLFGIKVNGMNVDYKGNLYKTAIPHPFSVDSLKEVESCQSKR